MSQRSKSPLHQSADRPKNGARRRLELDPSSCVGETPVLCRSIVAGGGRRPMTVKTIVSRKGRDVVTIEPSATLETAIATMAEHRIGAVVVLGAERRVIGILTERDIMRAFAEFGANALTKRLAQVMTREVATCGSRAGSTGRHRVDRRHRQTPTVGNGAGVRGTARVYPERLGCENKHSSCQTRLRKSVSDLSASILGVLQRRGQHLLDCAERSSSEAGIVRAECAKLDGESAMERHRLLPCKLPSDIV
jgi:hypothetical protein